VSARLASSCGRYGLGVISIGRRAGVVGLSLALLVVLASACSSGSSDVSGRSSSTSTTRPGSTTTGSTADPSPTSPLSAGCDANAALPAGRSVVTLGSGATARSYVRYVPTGIDPTKPSPLIIDFTAYSPASMEEAFSGWTTPNADGKVKADEVGAVVVTPEPVNGKGLLTWNVDHTKGWTDDQRFVTEVLDDVQHDMCISLDRVLASGFAIGGVMASAVACEQPERISVLATVSGLWDPPTCSSARATPVISFHGTGDHFLPFDGGVGDHVGQLGLSGETSTGLAAMASRPGALASSEAWAKRDGCDAKATDHAVTKGVTRKVWIGCTDGADVELYVIDGGSHTWPGSNGMANYESLLGPVSDAVSATDLMWTFFTQQAPAGTA